MTQNNIDLYIEKHKKHFPAESIDYIRKMLNETADEKIPEILAVKLRNPLSMLFVSMFLGSFGIDRFMIGDIGTGMFKLLTFGLYGLLTVADCFTVMRKTREYNLKIIMKLLK